MGPSCLPVPRGRGPKGLAIAAAIGSFPVSILHNQRERG